METLASEISFAACTERDIPTLSALAEEAYPPAYTFVWKHGDPSYYFDLSFSKEAFTKDFQNPNVTYYLVKYEHAKAGFFKLNLHAQVGTFTAEEALELEKIYLLQHYTGKGLGEAALHFITEKAKQLHKKIVWLDVMSVSKAQGFYEKLGFRTVSRHSLSYPNLHDHMREMQRMLLKL